MDKDNILRTFIKSVFFLADGMSRIDVSKMLKVNEDKSIRKLIPIPCKDAEGKSENMDGLIWVTLALMPSNKPIEAESVHVIRIDLALYLSIN